MITAVSRPTSETVTASTNLADHSTPLLRNCWYVAALSDEIGENALERTLLGVGVLFYRTQDGAVIALRNRCPHRSFPLSKGSRRGDNVVCGYHGLEFRPDGSCAHVPAQTSIPTAVRAQSYRVIERAPLIWIWMGDPELADAARIPEHGWLDTAEYACLSGYHYVKSNYIRLHENVLDLTHFPYVHGEAVGDLSFVQGPYDVKKDGDTVCVVRRVENQPVNPVNAARIGNHGHRVTRHTESWFKTAGFHVAFSTLEDLDGGVNGQTTFRAHIVHMPTPETATTTHYFWANTRNYNLDDAALSERTRQATAAVFQEDVVALEAIESIWDKEGYGFAEISVLGDRPGLLMRRIISRLAAEEA